MLADAFRLVQVAVLGACLPLAVVAARGYRDAPFGRFLRPLVPITALYLLLAAGKTLAGNAAQFRLVELVVGSVALVLVTYAVGQLLLLLTGRRAL
ncbi:hypothetical protein Hbl1158_07070 [Halobaculum sp. CBA1158]|uniref:hypothetical protein n=1 Tax=Halobaculum sp. CBA1158 TaxID=2904243 RepID=UPI001F3C0A16|nr:hypothetical protein [Halobaculum sp. CBA1158]UIP01100.1 hypothetical protein Hbl1158_07070 [Halobaculum sp. CBA1158]